MKINAIQNICVPQFTSNRKTAPVTLPEDVFVRATNPRLEAYYGKLNDEMGVVRADDVENMAFSIQAKRPDIPLEKIYDTMLELSKYSSYASWVNLEHSFKDMNVFRIEGHPANLYMGNYTRAIPIALTSVMSYLFDKNCQNLKYGQDGESAVIYDKNLISILEESPYTLKELKKENLMPIYIRGFDNGYNFLNQNENFEDFVLKVLAKTNGNKNRLNEYLDGQNLRSLKALGIEPKIIDVNNLKPTPSVIADNLNPIMITKAELAKAEKEFNPQGIMIPKDQYFWDFLDSMMVVVSPQKFAQNLKEMHGQINNFMEQQGLKNPYYIVPNVSKSFGLVNYMFKNINDIPADRYLYTNLNYAPVEVANLLKFIPDNSTFIVLDDCAVTGSSLVNSQLFYEKFEKSLIFADKNINVIIAPMYATKNSRKTIEMVSKAKNHKDTVIINKVLPELPKNLELKGLANSLLTFFDNSYTTSLIFPYMGPDTNHSDFLNVYDKFLYSPNAQKPL